MLTHPLAPPEHPPSPITAHCRRAGALACAVRCARTRTGWASVHTTQTDEARSTYNTYNRERERERERRTRTGTRSPHGCSEHPQPLQLSMGVDCSSWVSSPTNYSHSLRVSGVTTSRSAAQGDMAGWGFSLESLKSKVQEAGEKVAMRAMPRAPDACAERCCPGNRLGVCAAAAGGATAVGRLTRRGAGGRSRPR